MTNNKKDLVSLEDYTKTDILNILQTAKELKKDRYTDHSLKNKVIALIFGKSSTRTRISFETGIYQLGGKSIFLPASELQIGRGESIYDTAKVMERYVDAVVIRTFDHQDVIDFAKHSSLNVINGLTDLFHPCQALTDIFTIWEHFKSLDKVKLAYVGDGNNMAHSLALACETLGVPFHIASPPGYGCHQSIIDQCQAFGHFSQDPIEAVKNANVVYTDVWASMGQESESNKRQSDFKNYQINQNLLKHAQGNYLFLHCLPAHRGEEVTEDIIDGEHSRVFDQAENRLHVQKAIMKLLLTS